METERELAGKPSNQFTNRVHDLLEQLDNMRMQELEDKNITVPFQRVLTVLFGELQPYLETPEEKELTKKKKRVIELPFGFSNRVVLNSLSNDVVFKWDVPDDKGINGMAKYRLKWKLLDELEFGLRSVVRRCNFDVYEQKTRTRPF